MCRNAGQCTDTQSSTRQIAAHISKAAYGDSNGNQTYKEFSEQWTVIKGNLQCFRQILLGYYAQTCCHTLCNNNGNYGKDYAPQQFIAITGAGSGRACYGTGTDKGTTD